MNRALLLSLVAPLALAAGCGVDCGDPTQVNGRYAVFANVLTFDGTNLEEFPSYGSPANGFSEWTIDWDRVAGEVHLTIDDFPFTGTGVWDDIECGNFTLDFAGPYTDADGASHDLTATGSYVVFADQLVGDWTYSETWTSLDGESGTFDADGQVAGQVLAAGE
jgi:hypothetical protein